MEYYTPDDFTSVEKFDGHVHVNTVDGNFIQQSKDDNFRLVTINVDIPGFPSIDDQQHFAVEQSKKYSGDLYYATTFSVKNFNTGTWLNETISYLEKSFAAGAAAVKVWKNIGMELKDDEGNFVMIDNPKFEPVFNLLIKHGIPLIGHIGEPKNCWLPVDKMTVKGDINYFSAHPEYHMYLHPECPSYEDHINARDRVLEKHPDLKFIGAHFGSLEWSTGEIGKRLDKFPNMAVDTAERISHLQHQSVTDWQKVYDFFIKYQDRIIYGTDIIVDETTDPAEMKKHAHDIRLRHWQYFTSGEMMRVPKVEGEFRGLRLPKEVVDKIYRTNAEDWMKRIRKWA